MEAGLTNVFETDLTATIDNMVLADLLNLTDAEYGLRIQDYSNEKLLNQLKVKNMQVKVGYALESSSTFTSGLAGSLLGHAEYIPVICGSISQVGKRRVVVSKQKIRLIEDELQKRGNSTADIQEVAQGPPAYEDLLVGNGDMPKVELIVEYNSSCHTATRRGNSVTWMALVLVLLAILILVFSINTVVLQTWGNSISHLVMG
jgi:hypothetical protein